MTRSRAAASRRWLWTLCWLGPLLLAWGVLSVLAHHTSLWAIHATSWLFGCLLLLSYGVLWGWAAGMTRHPRLTLFRAVACTLALTGILLCLELPVLLKLVHWRLVFEQLAGDGWRYGWAYRLDSDLEFRRRPHEQWSERSSSDIELGWNMPPSLRAPLVYTYDRWGYRNPVDMEQADIVLIGDSYVEGWYVSDDDTVARRLQVQLDHAVMNFGIAGYGTLHEYRVLTQDAIRFQPKVVLWFFFEGNDVYDDYRFEQFLLAQFPNLSESTAHPHGVAWRGRWTEHTFTLNVFQRLRRWLDPVFPNRAPYFGRLTVPGQEAETVYFATYGAASWTEWIAARWQKTRATLEQVVEFGRAQDIHILFVFVPIKFRVYQPFITFAPDSPCRTWGVWPIDTLFAEFCRATGSSCLDLTPIFQADIRTGGMPYVSVDTHWSAAGHALVADRLALELHQRGWLTTPLPEQ